ncbi:MAG: hypothetical protein RIC95_06255 [Vicingaceae bacterium]
MDKEFKKYRKQEAYQVPENYFEDFAYRMQLEIGEEEKSTSWLTKLSHKLQLRWSIPTFVVLALVSFSIWLNSSQSHYMIDDEIKAFLVEDQSRWSANTELLDLAYQDNSNASTLFNDAELKAYLEEESSDLEVYENFE